MPGVCFVVRAEKIGADVAASGAKDRESGQFSNVGEWHVGDRSLVFTN